jgi:hypothetical protein
MSSEAPSKSWERGAVCGARISKVRTWCIGGAPNRHPAATTAQSRRGHKVKQAVDAEMRHRACADQRVEAGPQPADRDELPAHSYNPIGPHMIVGVSDIDRVESRHEPAEQRCDGEDY